MAEKDLDAIPKLVGESLPEYTGPMSDPTKAVLIVTNPTEPENNRQLFYVSLPALVPDAVPAGAVIAYAGSGTPPGRWLYAAGASISRAVYADLFQVIGTTYGSSSADTFNLPDYRAVFLRGDGTKTYAVNVNGNQVNTTVASEPLGVLQSDAARKITGTFAADRRNGSGAFLFGSQYGTYGGNGEGRPGSWKFDSSRVVPVDVENRPVNMSVRYFIRY